MKESFYLLLFFFIIGCESSNKKQSDSFSIVIPEHFDNPIFPKDNALTSSKITLGEKLFFDPRLSKNNNISCASCHIPELAFSDSLSVSVGTNGILGFRNSPSIVNVAYKSLFHKDGGVRSLELQVLAPIIDSNEMAGDFLVILELLQTDSLYVNLFRKAFDTEPTVFGITRAIASYERSLIYGNSPYDQYLNGHVDALTASQINGMKLFQSKKLNCVQCHSGNMFTDFSYQNIGLEPQFEDSGRARITYVPQDAGKFEVPTLRNVSVTAPYMHNGSINTLEAVIRYFENGGGSHYNKSELIQPFQLTENERKDLLNFLESLTDPAFRKTKR